MSFAADAIGFYLQLEDQLTPALESSEKAYIRFVKSLDKYNQRAFKSANKGFDVLTNLVQSFTELPKLAKESFEKAHKALRAKIKPLVQPVLLQFTPSSVKGLSKAIGAAINQALRKATIRLIPTAPRSKSKLFDTSTNLRQLWKGLPQPPDMRGGFQGLPRYQTGGTVEDPSGKARKDMDSVLAWLQPGEFVVPKDIVDQLRNAKGQFEQMPEGLRDTLADINNIKTAMEQMKDAMDAGLDGGAVEDYARATDMLAKKTVDLNDITQDLGLKTILHFKDAIKDTRGEMEEMNEVVEEQTTLLGKLLSKILSPARFLAINKAIGQTQEALSGLKTGAMDTADAFGAGAGSVDTFMGNMKESNKILSQSREEMHANAAATMEHTQANYGNLVSLTQVGEARATLVDLGVRSEEQLRRMAPLAAALSQTTGIALGNIGKNLYELTGIYKLTTDQATAYILSLNKMQSAAAITADELESRMQGLLEGGLSLYIQQEITDPATKKRVMESMAGLVTAMSDQWVDGGGEMASMLVGALADPAKWGKLEMVAGMSVEQLKQGLIDQDIEGVMKTITDNIAMHMQDATSAQDLLVKMQGIGFEGTDQDLTNLLKKQDELLASSRTVQGTFVDQADAQRALREEVEKTTSGWDRFSNAVGNWITSAIPAGVLEFFDEFNFQAMHSVVFLGQQAWALGKSLAALIAKALGLATVTTAQVAQTAATTAATVATVAQTAAATTATAATGGLGGAIASLGTGIGTFIAQIGTGAGAAVSGFLTGLGTGLVALAGGLVALTPAIPVMIVLGGIISVGIIAFGVALRIATPAIDAFGVVIEKVMTGFVNLFSIFMEMDAGQLLALGPALMMMGIAFTTMGGGILAGSVMMAAAVPALIVFSVAMALFGGGDLGSGSIADTLNSMASAFVVDKGTLKAATEGIKAAGEFMASFLAVSLGMNLAGMLSGGGIIGTALKGIRWFFVGDPMANLVRDAKDMQTTVNALVKTFGDTGWSDDLPKAAVGIEAAGTFMKSYGDIAKALGAAAKVAPSAKMLNVMGVWFASTPLLDLIRSGPKMVLTVNFLAETFGKMDVSETLPKATKNVVAMATFMGEVGKVSKSLGDVREIADTGFWNWIGRGFGEKTLAAIETAAPKMGDAVLALTKGLAPLRGKQAIAGMKNVTTGVKVAHAMVEGISGVAKILVKSEDAFTAVAGMEIKSEPMAAAVDALLTSFGSLIQKHGTSLKTTGGSMSLLHDTVQGIGGVAKTMMDFEDEFDYMADMDVERMTESIDAMGNLITKATGTAAMIRSKIAAKMLTPKELKAVTVVQVTGDVNAKDAETHKLLRQLAELLGRSGSYSKPRQPTGLPAPRRAGMGTQALAGGNRAGRPLDARGG